MSSGKRVKPPVTKSLVLLDWGCFAIWLICVVTDLIGHNPNTGMFICHVAAAVAFLISSVLTTRRYLREQRENAKGLPPQKEKAE